MVIWSLWWVRVLAKISSPKASILWTSPSLPWCEWVLGLLSLSLRWFGHRAVGDCVAGNQEADLVFGSVVAFFCDCDCLSCWWNWSLVIIWWALFCSTCYMVWLWSMFSLDRNLMLGFWLVNGYQIKQKSLPIGVVVMCIDRTGWYLYNRRKGGSVLCYFYSILMRVGNTP